MTKFPETSEDEDTAQRVDASEWMNAILGRFSSVAEPRQLDHARYLFADDWLTGLKITPIGPSLDELGKRLAAIKAAPAPAPAPPTPGPTISVPAAAGTYEVTCDGVTLTVTVAVKPCCDPQEPKPCQGCLDEHLAVPEEKAKAKAKKEIVVESPKPRAKPKSKPAADPVPPKPVEPDPLVDLPFPRPVREPFLQPVLPPLPRPLPASGSRTLAGLAEAQAEAYAALGNAVGDLFAKTFRELAKSIQATGAKTVAEYEDRIEVMQRSHEEKIQAEYYDRGYEAAMEQCAVPC